MKVIVCLDDNSGMLFNNRRQSRDKAVCEDVINSLNGEKLCISAFSSTLFEGLEDKISVCENFESKGTFFVENQALSQFDIEEVIVYRWNRVYPADFYCDIDFSKYTLLSQTELKGNSHEKITKQVYVK